MTLRFSGWILGDLARPAAAGHCELTEGEGAVIRYDEGADSLVFAPDTGPHPHGLAVVTARDGHWCLTNLHAEDTYFVENMESGGEFVKVVPRRRDIPIPFELARIVLPVPKGAGKVDVFGPEPHYLAPSSLSESAANWPRLDESCVYFRVLVALCEPQLRGSPPGAVPTIAEVVERLRGCRPVYRISRAAVNHHIDYLATHKLRVGEWAGAADGKRSYWKREAIVAMALRSGLVGEEHLKMLPNQRVTGRQAPDPLRAPVPPRRSRR